MLKKFGIREIAELSGYSTATVSRVLSNKGKYSIQAKEKILQIIADHERQEHSADDTSIEQRKMRFVGVTIPGLSDDFFSIIVMQIQKKLIKRGFYPIMVRFGYHGLSVEEITQLFKEIGVISVICVSEMLSIEQIAAIGVPVIIINRWFAQNPPEDLQLKYACIHTDYEAAGKLAAKVLNENGCTKIAYVDGVRAANLSSLIRKKAFHEEAVTRGLECYETEVNEALNEIESGYENMKSLLDNGIVPDGIFCATDWIAMSAITCLTDHGFRVPEDVNVLGFGNVSEYPRFSLKLSTIDMNIDSIVTEAAFLATSAVTDPDFTNKEIVMPVSYIPGKTIQ